MKNSSRYFSNYECENFPCHKTDIPDDFNCLFCYCPLYALGEQCGGKFQYTEQGIKDCSACLIPHRRENYLQVLEKMQAIIEMAKKKEQA